MENQLLSFNFISSILLFLLLVYWLVKGQKKSKQLRLPPSPWKLPLIGHLHHLIGTNPHRLLSNLSQKYGPIMHLQLGQVSAIIISSREAAKDVYKVNDLACADRPESIGMKIMWYNYTDIAFSPYNEYWRQMRKVCTMELLSAKNVRSFASIRLDETSRLIKSIQSSSGEPINLTEKIFSFTSSMICRAAFGKVPRDGDTLIRLLREGATMAGGFELADFFPSSKFLQVMSWNKHSRLWEMRGKLDSILDSLISEHKQKPCNGELGREDIVDVLIRLQQSGELDIQITNDNIKAVLFDLFSAGTDTSSTTLDWTMAELMRNPNVMAKAQAEVREIAKGKETFEESDLQSLKYLKMVVKESFRMHPPIPILPKACREECEVNGFTIPLKAKIMINIWALGRDPECWDKPESFKPERFENSSVDFTGNSFELLPFGGGRRMCPGMNFGLVNVELPLAMILFHFNWKLPQGMNPNDIGMAEREGLTVSRKDELYLVPTPYVDPSIHG